MLEMWAKLEHSQVVIWPSMRPALSLKGATIDRVLRAVGHPLCNKGTGRFDMLGMDLNRSNGWRISPWNAASKDGKSDAWVTVVDESGKHVVTNLTPLINNACDYWLVG